MKVVIDGKQVDFFTSGKIDFKLDSVASTFAFQARFSANNVDHQQIFKPLQYLPVEIFSDSGKLLLTGTILNHVFNSDSKRHLVGVSGYSKCGILENVQIPVKNYPLQYNGLTLEEITKKVCSFFGVGYVVRDSNDLTAKTGLADKKAFYSDPSVFAGLKNKLNSKIKKIEIGPTETAKGILAKIAAQKNVILSHTEKGEVFYFVPDLLQKPKYFFDKKNTLEMSSNFNGQEMHTEINVVRQPSKENSGAVTVDKAINTLIQGIYKPTTKILSSGEDTDVKIAADNELGSELKNISYNVKLQGLFDQLYCGEIVNVHNHYIYCYAYNRMMINGISFSFDEKGEYTELSLCLPEVYSGGPLIRNVLFNHKDEDQFLEPHLNEEFSDYVGRKDIL